MAEESLTPLERELLQLCADMGETTTELDLGMRATGSSPGRYALAAALRGLVDRGLMTTERGAYGGTRELPDGSERTTVYEDDWWDLTAAGRAAIGLPPRRPESRWMNPSSGPYRVSPLIAPWCAFRFRRGKEPVPAWYRRLTGTPPIGR